MAAASLAGLGDVEALEQRLGQAKARRTDALALRQGAMAEVEEARNNA